MIYIEPEKLVRCEPCGLIMPHYYYEMNLKKRVSEINLQREYQANLMIFHHNHWKRERITDNVNYNPEKGKHIYIFNLIDNEGNINKVQESITASTMIKSEPAFQPDKINSFLRVADDYEVEKSIDDSEKANENPQDNSFIASDESELSFNQNLYKNLQNPSSVSDTIPSDHTVLIGNGIDPVKLKENEKIKTLFWFDFI